MKAYYKVLHYLSIIFSFMLLFSILFTVQNTAFNLLLKRLTVVVFDKFYLHQLIFILTSILLIKRFVKLDSLYRNLR